MSDDFAPNDFNRGVIDEFRANGGRVGGYFEGKPLLLLHSTGARTAATRVNPVMYQSLDHGWAVFASNGGQATNPNWDHNVIAHPQVTAEFGDHTTAVTARVAAGDEHDAIWEQQKQDYPQFADYEAGTDRVIPVVVLEPVD
jgi:deazaflavin-dependent oxidoreductase (nitroreductase family)